MPPFPALVGPSYQGASHVADFERCVGFYLEAQSAPGAVFPWSLLPLPGLTSVATPAEGPGRGLWSQDGRLLRCAGFKIYEVDRAWAHTDRGSVVMDARPAQFASSGDAGAEVAIASAGFISIFDLTSNLLSAAVAGLTAHQVAYLHGYFIGLNRLTSTIRLSNLLDGTTWDPTQFAQRSGAGDRWQAIHVCGEYLYLFGSETSDVWYDAGSFPFPFAPVQGAVIPMGIAAPWSVATVAAAPIWLAQTKDGARSVVRGNGTGMPVRISTHAIDTALRGYGTVDDAEASVFEFQGHAFYVLTLPTAGVTWCYDVVTDAWSEWPAWNGTAGRYEANLAVHRTVAFDSYVADSRTVGTLFTASGSVYSDNGGTIRRMRVVPFPRLTPDAIWVFLSQLELFLETGLGLQAGQGSDPTVALRVTRDGGRTWGSERTCSAGAVGKYLTRVVWNRLGRYRDGLGGIELVFSDPIPWRINGASFQAAGGSS